MCLLGVFSSWGSFLGTLTRIFESFEENHRKLRSARSTSVIGDWDRHLSSTRLVGRSARSLIWLDFEKISNWPVTNLYAFITCCWLYFPLWLRDKKKHFRVTAIHNLKVTFKVFVCTVFLHLSYSQTCVTKWYMGSSRMQLISNLSH